MNRKKIIISASMSLFLGNAIAQQKPADTLLKATTIEITQIYQPQIKQAVKETYSPALPPADNSRPDFTYDVPAQVLNYSYKPLPLQPLAIGSDTTQNGYHHYIKAGLGNRRTLFLDAGLGGFASKNFETNAHLGVLSQKGEFDYQKQTAIALTAEGAYAKKELKANIGLDLAHYNFFQYGYDEVLQPNKIAAKQGLSGGSINLSLLKGKALFGWTPEAKAKISLYTGSYISNENTAAGGLYISKQFDSSEWSAKFGVEGVSTHTNNPPLSVNNSYASLKAGTEFDNNKLILKAYLIPTIGQNGTAFLLNDIELKLHFEKTQTNIGVGSKGSLVQNTYQQQYLNNPFISTFSFRQTHSDEWYAFVEQGIGNHVTFNGKLSSWRYENFATSFNDPVGDHEKMISMFIPRVNALSVQVGLRYQIAEMISVGGQLAFFDYDNLSSNARVWHTPNKRINGDVLWRPIPDLSLTAYSAYVGGNFAVDSTFKEVRVKPFLDLGIGAEYSVMKRLSFWINGNNLLNSKYQRWLGYQAYGINIYGGVRLKF